MSLEVIKPLAQTRHRLHQEREQPAVLTGAQFRRLLRWGKDRFSAAVRSGRFTHLISVNASSRSRTVYVKAKVEAWLSETPASALRASQQRGSRG